MCRRFCKLCDDIFITDKKNSKQCPKCKEEKIKDKMRKKLNL